MSVLFYDWLRPMAISLKTPQDLGSLINAKDAVNMRMYLGGGISLLLLIIIFKSSEFRSSFDNILGGLVVGLCIVAGWYISGALISVKADGEMMNLVGYAENWSMFADSDAGQTG